jgi:hypothetical protein
MKASTLWAAEDTFQDNSDYYTMLSLEHNPH